MLHCALVNYTNIYICSFRCQILNHDSSCEDFLKMLTDDLPSAIQHDFLAKTQASFFKMAKNTIKEGEFVVSLDFAENYTCQVQNAIQSQHWANIQATLHTYVIYHKVNDSVKNINYVLISECLQHDASAVHFYNSQLISHLKNQFGAECVKKIIYFSDGAASQYKNKYNFINLLKHEEDFGVKAEWHFFATSHGKGACDGIGGTVKRHAYRSTLQSKDITSPKLLCDWAKGFFKNIRFDYSTNEDHIQHKSYLNERFDNATTIKHTRQYHAFVPTNGNKLKCKSFSKSDKFVLEGVVKNDFH